MADKDFTTQQKNASARWLPVTLVPTAGQSMRFNATKDASLTTDWGISSDRGDADVTLANFTDAPVQRFATALTGNKTVTLPTTNNYNGAFFRIVRTGLGAFTLDVGGLKTIPNSTAAFVDVAHDGTAWRLIGYGDL